MSKNHVLREHTGCGAFGEKRKLPAASSCGLIGMTTDTPKLQRLCNEPTETIVP